MPPRYLRIRDLASTPATHRKPARSGRYPVSPATIWRWVKLKRDAFPAPISLGPQTTAWRVDELDAWDAKRASRSVEPAAQHVHLPAPKKAAE